MDSPEPYILITHQNEVRELAAAILNTQPEPVLGIDCEGLAKGRPLSLVQVNFNV
jgi:hypothetical protein